jgi:hypothetical protein
MTADNFIASNFRDMTGRSFDFSCGRAGRVERSETHQGARRRTAVLGFADFIVGPAPGGWPTLQVHHGAGAAVR